MTIRHAMILAAGLGTRMKPLTLEKPKSLIKVGNKNLLERSINLLENHGVEQITINVHHLADQIEKHLGTDTATSRKDCSTAHRSLNSKLQTARQWLG